jgi:hypothetical protein
MTEQRLSGFEWNASASQPFAEGVRKVMNAFQDAFFCRQADKSPCPLPCGVVELSDRVAPVCERVVLLLVAPGFDHPAKPPFCRSLLLR